MNLHYHIAVAHEEAARLFGDIKATLRFWREIRHAGRHGDVLDQRIVDAGMSMVSSAVDRMDHAENPEAFR